MKMTEAEIYEAMMKRSKRYLLIQRYFAENLLGWKWVESDREEGNFNWYDSDGDVRWEEEYLDERKMLLVKAMQKRGWNLTVTWDSNEWPIVEWQNESSKFTVCLEDFDRCIYACTMRALRAEK